MHTSLLALTLPLLLSPFAHSIPVKRSVTGPVITTDFPDPSLMKSGSTYYAFGTQSLYSQPSIHIQVATSPDFTTWTLQSNTDALPSLPAWVNATSPLVWAPDVTELSPGHWLMYFSATTTTAGNEGIHCIGTATATSITGPFVPNEDVWACPAAQGGAIDPVAFVDSDGTRYVVYKIDGNSVGHGGSCGNSVAPIAPTQIMLQQVGADGVSLIGSPVQILSNDPADGPDVEAPSLILKDGTYYLFFSSNCYSTDAYDVSYATASSVGGPYTKQDPLLVTGMDGLSGPGGADVSSDGERMLFHGLIGGGERGLFAADVGVGGGRVSV